MNDIPEELIQELSEALHTMTYGSIELFVQDNTVTQITVRNIKKTSVKTKQKIEHHHITASSVKNRITAQGKIHIKLRP